MLMLPYKVLPVFIVIVARLIKILLLRLSFGGCTLTGFRRRNNKQPKHILYKRETVKVPKYEYILDFLSQKDELNEPPTLTNGNDKNDSDSDNRD